MLHSLFLWTSYLVAKVKIKLSICYYCRIIPESGRWLLVRGRVDEAGQMVRKFAKKNSIMSDYLNRALAKCSRGEILARTRKIRHSPLDLFRTPRMRKRTLILWFCWWVVVAYHKGRELNKELITDSFFDYALWEAFAQSINSQAFSFLTSF